MAVFNPPAAVDLDDVRHAMGKLSIEHRQALNLVSVEGMTLRDAALICGCAVGTMRSRVDRAREALAALTARGRFSGEAMAAILADAQRACSPGGRRTFYPC